MKVYSLIYSLNEWIVCNKFNSSHVQMELNIIQFKWTQHSKNPAIHVAVQEALVSS